MAGPRNPNKEYWEPTKLHWWYDRLCQIMISQPNLTKKDIAKQLECTPQTIYLITNSDTFKEYYSMRMGELHNVNKTLVEKTAAMTEMAIDHINDHLAGPSGGLTPHMELVQIAEKGLKSLGYGVSAPAGAMPVNPTQININISSGELEQARARMKEAYGEAALKTQDRSSLPSPDAPKGERLLAAPRD